jgi:HEAT repeat protein
MQALLRLLGRCRYFGGGALPRKSAHLAARWWPNVDDVPAESQGPSHKTVEWGKALVAAGFTDEIVAELLELVRHGTDDRAEVGAWAFAFGEIPQRLRIGTLRSLLDVLADSGRPAEVRGGVAEAVAEQLEFSEETELLRRAAEAVLIGLLDDDSAVVRFWAAFGLGKLKTPAALPALQALTGDDTPVPRWWTVGEEAADAIEWIEGRVPPGRVGTGATEGTAAPQNPPRPEDAG